MKSLLAGGGVFTLAALPSKWVKPVVDAVILPTHAQTSPDGGGGDSASGYAVEEIVETRAPGWLDHLFRTAYASDVVVIPSGFLCVESDGDESYNASYSFDSQVATGGGSFGACTSLSCGEDGVDLIVTGENGDGSFDFELYPLGSACQGSPAISTTTDTKCDVKSENCLVEEKEGP